MGSGFGPSSGRLVEACEFSEVRGRMKMRSTPPTIGMLALAGAFLGFVFGVTFLYEDEEMLGVVVLILAVTFVALPVIWTIRARR